MRFTLHHAVFLLGILSLIGLVAGCSRAPSSHTAGRRPGGVADTDRSTAADSPPASASTVQSHSDQREEPVALTLESDWAASDRHRVSIAGLAFSENTKYRPKGEARLRVALDKPEFILAEFTGWPAEAEGRQVRVEGTLRIFQDSQGHIDDKGLWVDAGGAPIQGYGLGVKVYELYDCEWRVAN